jgi:hypothetical protein
MKNIRSSLLKHLFEPCLDPKLFPNEQLFYWTAQPRNPVLACNDDLANIFIKAMVTGEAVQFVYCGGSEPGNNRLGQGLGRFAAIAPVQDVINGSGIFNAQWSRHKGDVAQEKSIGQA